MKLKWLFLFGLIVFPVCIYLFLQAFGQNQFSIPVYYENGVEKPLDGCSITASNEPYHTVKFYEVDSTQADFESDKVVVYDLGAVLSNNGNIRNNLLTFLNKFQGYEEIKFISLSTTDLDMGTLSTFDHALIYQSSAEDIMNFGRCVLQADIMYNSEKDAFENMTLVLCDSDRKIRGYYDPTQLKEIDRLNTELYILLSN